MGFRLRWLEEPEAHDFNWRDLWVILENLPTSSAAARVIDGAEAIEWNLTNHLLAICGDALNYLSWTKTEASQKKGAVPPDPIPRPGLEKPGNHMETDSMDRDEAKDFLGPEFAELFDQTEHQT